MTSNADPVSPLAALILSVIARAEADGDRLNYSDIARRGGPDLTRNNVQRYATRRLEQVIPLEKRRGLALGLRVHDVLVDRAVAESLGLLLDAQFDYDYRTDPLLSASDRREIDSLIEHVRNRNHSSGRSRRNA